MSNETKHTLGPWKRIARYGIQSVHGPEGDCVAVCDDIISPNFENALLIAAAPELLAAIKALLSETESLHLCHNETLMDEGCPAVSEDISIINARAIIAKAEGKQ